MILIGIKAPITIGYDWVQGETQGFEWPIYASDDRTLQDISGFTIEFRMAVDKGGTSVLTLPVSLTDPTHGECTLFITPSDIATLDPLTYWYELWRTDAGFEDRLAWGPAHLLAGVS